MNSATVSINDMLTDECCLSTRHESRSTATNRYYLGSIMIQSILSARRFESPHIVMYKRFRMNQSSAN